MGLVELILFFNRVSLKVFFTIFLAINTDAHSFHMLKHMEYGVKTARKGWIKKETVINTWDAEKLQRFFQSGKK